MKTKKIEFTLKELKKRVKLRADTTLPTSNNIFSKYQLTQALLESDFITLSLIKEIERLNRYGSKATGIDKKFKIPYAKEILKQRGNE